MDELEARQGPIQKPIQKMGQGVGQAPMQADLHIPADYSLIKLKELMRAAVNDAYQRQDAEYLEHFSMLMLGAVKTATSIRDAVVDGDKP
ncbi:MAG: hypothetical protein ACREVL_04000 [Solimonas sp.]